MRLLGSGEIDDRLHKESARYGAFVTGHLAKRCPGSESAHAPNGASWSIGRVHADRHKEIESAVAGEILAVVGLRGFATGDTLCSPETSLLTEAPVFLEPVASMAIEPERSSDSQRFATLLQMLGEDGPTFHVSTHAETSQTLTAGMEMPFCECGANSFIYCT